jgi:hypothetical protein
MIKRKSFFIRWFLHTDDDDDRQKHSVIEIEHIQSGNNRRLSSLEEASLWMREIEAEQKEVQDVDD